MIMPMAWGRRAGLTFAWFLVRSSRVTGHRVADVIVRPVALRETARFNVEPDARSRYLRLQSGGRVDREASCPDRVQETLVIGHEGG